MEARLREVQRAVAALGERGRTERVPDAVRGKVIAYTRAQRACGKSWKTIAREVGLCASGLQRWLREAPHLTQVKIVPDREPDAPKVSLISPHGYRIEGVTLLEALRALERFG